jgi:hypothetical protein
LTTPILTMHPVRQRRLDYGWQPMQFIGRLEILAQLAGVDLPKTYELLRALFLWEQHREPVPPAYSTLIEHVFRNPHALSNPRVTAPIEAEHTRASC